MVPIVLVRASTCVVPAAVTVSKTSIRTSTGRALCGSVISTTIATARSRSSHSTPVIRWRAVNSITTESCRTRKRTGAHSSPGRGGTHSVTAISQSRRSCADGPRSAQSGQILLAAPEDTHQYLDGVLAIQRRDPPYPAPWLSEELEGHTGAQERTGDGVVDLFP